MSKIARKPLLAQTGVSLSLEGNTALVTGPLGTISLPLPKTVKVSITGDQVLVTRVGETKQARADLGTTARLLGNCLTGVANGFSKSLEVFGTGYRAQMEGTELVLALGFSHPIRYTPPTGISLEVTDNRFIKVSGVDKALVGLITDRIHRFKKPDPYKGKGVRVVGKVLHLKPGKAAAKATK